MGELDERPGRLESDDPPSSLTGRSLSLSRRTLLEEVGVVLSLSLLASAVYAIIDLLSAPVSGVITLVYPQVGLATQLANIGFGLAPGWLVFYLVRRNREGLRAFGLDWSRPRQDVAWGLGLAVTVSSVGLAIYLASVALKVNRFVVPVPPLGHWWTWPVLILGAIQAGLLEEVVVAGYLIRRLEQVGLATSAAVALSAGLRGAYHLYQGWGGFTGNLVLGLFFGTMFAVRRRTWPLVIAHALVDILAGVGYIAFRGRCIWGACIR